MTVPPHRWPLFRYSTRALLVGVAVAAAAVALWIRPYSVEAFQPDGTLLARYRVQRSWRGDVVAHGPQEWFLPNGGCYRRQEVFGAIVREGELQSEGNIWRSGLPAPQAPRPAYG